MSTVIQRARVLGIALVVSAALITGGAIVAGAPVASAAPCVRFVGSQWDPAGNENYMPALNQEWVRIKNACSTTKSIGGWKIHDYGRKHTYTFPSTLKISAGATITLRSGTGTNSTTTRYWQRSYGAVWNNTGTERAYLRNGFGTLIHSWVEAGR